jgi:cytochrome P450
MAAEVRVSLKALRDDFESVFDGLAHSGDLVWVEAGEQRFLLVNDPDAVADVLVEKRAQLVKPRFQAIDTGPPRPEVVNTRIPVADLRRGISRGLADRDAVAATVAVEAAGAETATWSDGVRIEVMPMLRRIAIRVAAEGAFASSLDDDDVAGLDQILRWFDEAPRVVPASRFSRHNLRRKQRLHELSQIARRLLESSNPVARGELSALDELDLDDDAQASLVGELLLGAVGPLAQTASWLLFRFATEPAEAQLLRDEWPVTERTAAFVKEVTRLHPTNPRITRAAIVDTDVRGEPVPVHTRVVLNVNAINRDPRLYDDPERLAPERWLEDRPAKWGFLSFGLGERRCLGETVALASLAALLPALAANWELAFGDLRETSAGRRQLAEGTWLTVRGC